MSDHDTPGADIPSPEPSGTERRRPPVDLLSLVVGLLFVLVSGVALAGPSAALLRVLRTDLLLPGALVLAGLLILASLRRGPDRR
jgi:hypothetical protein